MMICGRPGLVFFRAIFILVFLCIFGCIGFLSEKYNGFSPGFLGWICISVVAVFLFFIFVIDCLDSKSLFSPGFRSLRKRYKLIYMVVYLVACFVVSSEVIVFNLHRYIGSVEYIKSEVFLLGKNEPAFCDRLVSFEYDGKNQRYCVSSKDYQNLWEYGFKYRKRYPDPRSKEVIESIKENIRFVARNESKRNQEEDVVTYLYPPMMYLGNKVSVLGSSFNGVDLREMPAPKPWPKPVPLNDKY